MRTRLYSPAVRQIMNVTCDNASNNDTMIDHMAVLLPGFEGDAATLAARRKEEPSDAPLEDDEEWVDEVESLSPEERDEFEQKVVPVKLVLAKVSVQES